MGTLARLERLLLAWQRSAVERSRWTVLITIAVLIFCAFGLGRLTQIVSIRDQLDPALTSTIDLQRADRDFSGEPSLIVTVKARGKNFMAGELCQVRRLVRDFEANRDFISNVTSPFDLRRGERVDGAIHYPALVEEVCLGDPSRNISLVPLQKTPWGHLFVGPQARDISFTVTFFPGPAEGKFGTFRPELVSDVIQKVEAEFPHRVHVTGTAAQEFYTMQGLAEAQWLNLIVFVIIAVSFRYFLGTWKSSLIYGMTILPAATIVYGLMGWFGHAIDPLSVCLFLMLAIASIEDFIFLSLEIANRQENLSGAIRTLILPSFMTSLTTVAAFGTLMFSDLESIRRFGAWAALGGAVEWVIMFICLPVILKLSPGLVAWSTAPQPTGGSLLRRLLQRSPPRLLVRLALLFFVSAFVSVTNFNLAQTPTDVFPKDHPLQRSIDAILKDRGWVASVGLVYDEDASDRLKLDLRNLIRSDSIVFLIESWPQIVDFIGEKFTTELDRKLIEREVSITDMYQRYHSPNGSERDILYLRSSNTAEVNRLRAIVQAQCPQRECWLTGEFVAFADFSQQLIVTLFESLFASLLVVAFIIGYCAWVRGQMALVPGLLISSFFGPAVMLTVIFAFGLSVNFVTCVVASTLIGLTGDNALMFLLTAKGKISQSVDERGIASIHTALIMALCSLTFVFSYFEPPRTLGVLLACGFLFSLLGDVWLLKGFLSKSSDD